MSDPGTSYRTRDEVQEVRQTQDPITGFKEKLVAAGMFQAEELKVRNNFCLCLGIFPKKLRTQIQSLLCKRLPVTFFHDFYILVTVQQDSVSVDA